MRIKGKIDSIAFGGEGILKHEGLVVFVPYTAPQDDVEIQIQAKKKNFARAKLVKIVENSPDRICPRCPYFGTCGGCQLQHLTDSAQIHAKRAFVIDALSRIGKIKIDDLTVVPAKDLWHYRRHIRLKLRKENTGFVAGYIGHDPSQFVPVNQCAIFLPESDPFLAKLQGFLQGLSSEGIEEASVRLIKNDQRILLAFQFSSFLPVNHPLTEKFIAENSQCEGILMQSPQELKQWGQTECEIQILGLKAKFSPFGFVQNHPEQNENLYKALLEELPGKSGKILDLYCGIGLTSLLFARKGWQSIGVESHPETVALAKENASLNGLISAIFYEGKSETVGIELLKKERPDAVLCNPPRTGLHPSVVQALLEVQPHCILYVSCMPATLARDLQKLAEGGYRIKQIQAFDMFPQTTHVETFVSLVKES